MRSTIKDVAKRANVSTATVSLVLHNHERISPDTRKKVQRAISDLDYHPSQAARGLVSKSTGNVGFILTEDHFLRTEPFYTRIFLGTEFEARNSEHFVLLTTIPPEFDHSQSLPRFILQRSVDGIIVAGRVPDLLFENLSKYKFPIVLIDYYPRIGDYPAILIDNIKGGISATEHLIGCGHKEIAFIAGDIRHPSLTDRFNGYKQALEMHQISFNPDLVVTHEGHADKESGYGAVRELLERKVNFTAIFAGNDAMAIGAMQLLKERNYRVPEQVSIIGFDDIESDLFVDPPITTMRVPKFDMGAEALKLINAIISKKEKAAKKILMPVELIVRGSTCSR